MAQDNRRRSSRVDCDVPIRLGAGKRHYNGRIVDLSRTGLRLRLPGKSIGVHRLSSIVQVTRNLRAALGDSFPGELHFETLGSLVKRTLTPRRIAKRDWEQADVEVGCQFESPLTDSEVELLGAPLPAMTPKPGTKAPRDRGRVGYRSGAAAPQRPHLRGRERPTYVTYLYPAPGKNSKPLVTTTSALTRGMAILEVETGQGWDEPDVALGDVVGALDDAYGTDVLLRVVDEEDDLWAGPAQVQEIDLHPETNRLKLGVAFGRELRSEELSRLGLPTPA